MERICLMASEEMLFENVDRRRTDGRRTPDSFLYYKLTFEPTTQVSLKINKKKDKKVKQSIQNLNQMHNTVSRVMSIFTKRA